MGVPLRVSGAILGYPWTYAESVGVRRIAVEHDRRHVGIGSRGVLDGVRQRHLEIAARGERRRWASR